MTLADGRFLIDKVQAIWGDMLQAGFLVIDREQKIVAVSPWLQSRMPAGEMAGQPFTMAFRARPEVARWPLHTLLTGECHDLSLPACPFSGQAGTYRLVTTALSDDQGRREGVLTTLQLYAIPEPVQDSLRQMAASAAHEIRNPLAGVRGYLQLLQKRLAGPEERNYLSIILQEIDRVNDLTRYLLALTRPGQTHPERLTVSALVREVLDAVMPRARAQGVTIEVCCDDTPWEVEGDRPKLMQVLLNLVHNALDAMADGGLLIIACSGDPNARVFRVGVQDTGPGIAPENLQRIFEPYFTTKSSGTGLGLALCCRFVQEMGGQVEVESQVGQGTLFRITLPLAGT